MADNVEANAGSGGATFAADDIAGIHYPRAKIVWGVDGSAVDASASNPLPVVQTGTHTVTANLSATDNAVLDQIDTNTDFGVVVGGGVEATALRVTIASDSTGVVSVDDGGGTLTVDGTVAVTGVATAANQTTIIGHVDGIEALLTTIDSDTSNLAVVGGGTEAAAIRVTIASDSTGVLSVDDNGGAISIDDGGNTITVDGTVAATQSGTWTAVPNPATTGGLSIFRSLDLDETEEEVKASAGMVYALFITNFATTTRFIKLYNATAANVTVGTTTPVITIAVPGNATDDTTLVWNGGGMGLAFDTAISAAATTGLADADTGAPAANDVLVNVFFK